MEIFQSLLGFIGNPKQFAIGLIGGFIFSLLTYANFKTRFQIEVKAQWDQTIFRLDPTWIEAERNEHTYGILAAVFVFIAILGFFG